MSMNVSLPPELEARVRQRVESGLYGSASEVIREALRLFEAYEQVKTAKLDGLRQDIAQGLSDAKKGRAKEVDFESIKKQGRRLLKTRKTNV
jgi:antitoxin ParD1/3/4